MHVCSVQKNVLSKLRKMKKSLPKLGSKWFAHNTYIKDLIQERLAGTNKSDYDIIKISGSSISAISQKAAHAIDSAVGGIGVKGKASLVKQLNTEKDRTLYYSVEF